MPINSKRKKFQLKKDTTNAKSQHQKIKFHIFWCVYDKASSVFKKIRLVIHQRKSWISIITYVKRILISEINKVICHFLYNDNKRKRVDE
jgi:hypothetical protein